MLLFCCVVWFVLFLLMGFVFVTDWFGFMDLVGFGYRVVYNSVAGFFVFGFLLFLI